MSDPVLCYIDPDCHFAFFTSQPLDQQWGDDWSDKPWEHNADDPYEYDDYDIQQKRAPWQITKIAFECDLELPNYGYLNSPYSVQEINRGMVPWLKARDYHPPFCAVMAGTPLSEFIRVIESRPCGKVYLLHKGDE